MCQALREWMEDSKNEGREEGREEGWKEGREEGRKEGREEGREEGRKEEKRKVALNLHALGFGDDQIAQAINCDVDILQGWFAESGAHSIGI